MSSLVPSKSATNTASSFAELPDAKFAVAARRTGLSVQTIREVLSLVQTFPPDAPPSPEDETRVLELIQGGPHDSPRMALLLLSQRWHSIMRLVSDDRANVRRKLIRLAWNEGKEDGHPRAGLILALQAARSDRRSSLLQPAEITSIFEKLSSIGYLPVYTAQANLALHEFNNCPDSDPERREALRERMLSLLQQGADKSFGLAATKLGLLYAEGEVVERDGRKAEEWWLRAARMGHVPAALYLGLVYQGRQPRRFGRKPLFPADRSKALKYFEASSAAAMGARHAGQFYYLDPNEPFFPSIEAHVEKWGVRPEDEKAVIYFAAASVFPGQARRGNWNKDYIGRTKMAEMLVYDRAPLRVERRPPGIKEVLGISGGVEDDTSPGDLRSSGSEAEDDSGDDDLTDTMDVSSNPLEPEVMSADDVDPSVQDERIQKEFSKDVVDLSSDPKALRLAKLQLATQILATIPRKRMPRRFPGGHILKRIPELIEELEKGGSGLPADLKPLRRKEQSQKAAKKSTEDAADEPVSEPAGEPADEPAKEAP